MRRRHGAVRAAAGSLAWRSGLAAEDSVLRHYEGTGRRIAARRWRGSAGEIDLVAEEGDGLVFVEVKSADSHDRAAERLSRGQMARIYAAAAEFLSGRPAGQATPVRFDVALVDSAGRIEVREAAFGLG
ncbi:MAG: YraN family protein [Rhodobacteraceae bacterium]|nr:YraN family protein [Paracoccaceae bacterium]